MLVESKFDMDELKQGDLLVVRVPNHYVCDKESGLNYGFEHRKLYINGCEVVGKLKGLKK